MQGQICDTDKGDYPAHSLCGYPRTKNVRQAASPQEGIALAEETEAPAEETAEEENAEKDAEEASQPVDEEDAGE